MSYDSASLKAKVKMKNQSVTAVKVRMGIVPRVGVWTARGHQGLSWGPEMLDVLIWVVATQA